MVKDLPMMVIECITVDQRTNMNIVLDLSSTAQLPTVSWDAKQFQVTVQTVNTITKLTTL